MENRDACPTLLPSCEGQRITNGGFRWLTILLRSQWNQTTRAFAIYWSLWPRSRHRITYDHVAGCWFLYTNAKIDNKPLLLLIPFCLVWRNQWHAARDSRYLCDWKGMRLVGGDTYITWLSRYCWRHAAAWRIPCTYCIVVTMDRSKLL